MTPVSPRPLARVAIPALLACLAAAAVAGCAAEGAPARQDVLVDPAGGAMPGFSTVARLADVPFSALGPGSTVIVRAGTYDGPVYVAARGSAEASVTIKAAPGAAPTLTDSVVFENAVYVTVIGLTVRGARNSGFILRRGSAHVTVSGSTVAGSGLGIWIGDGAGAGHRITGNTLADNETHGIAVDVINAPPDDPSYILANTVTGNGIHGLEINGSGYVVEGNRVSGNGTRVSGTSGIHVFAKDADQDAGDRNTIRYNLVTGQHETTGQDGNGIQVDQWCDGNTVAFNVAAGNDGAGINLFDAARNTVVNNTVVGNMRDPGGRHVYRGEIVIASDYTRSIDRASDNRVLNNLVVSTRRDVAAIAVEATTVDNGNRIGPNLLANTMGGSLYLWGTARADDGARLPLGAAAPDLVAAPRFVDPASPMAGGLALAAAPARPGLALGATRDITGHAYAGGEAPTFGAYRSP